MGAHNYACLEEPSRTHAHNSTTEHVHARQDMLATHTYTHTHETGLHENDRSCGNAVFSDPFGNLESDLQQNLGFKDGL